MSVSALLVAFVLIFASSIAILKTERQSDSNIKSPSDALWWAMSTVTTVGYGDKYPATNEGRIVGVILMISGVGIFGVLSGAIASWAVKNEEQEMEIHDQFRKLNEISKELAEIKELVRQQTESAKKSS